MSHYILSGVTLQCISRQGEIETFCSVQGSAAQFKVKLSSCTVDHNDSSQSAALKLGEIEGQETNTKARAVGRLVTQYCLVGLFNTNNCLVCIFI